MADQLTITGIITHVLDPRSGVSERTGKKWFSQDYVIETEEQYPRHCCFSIKDEARNKAFGIVEGQRRTAYLGIDAHEYQGKWFNEITAWKVE